MEIAIQPIRQEDIYRLWEIGFSKPKEWMTWNAPYFKEKNIYTYEEFLQLSFYHSESFYGVYANQHLVGSVSYYWENKETKWLEIGGVIYDENYWNQSIGSKALSLLITHIFVTFPDLEHIGLTTFSKNQRMMACALKIGMMQEACIRKVRYWNGVYYDSVKYGILREEWEKIEDNYG
ncbi:MULTISPECIES: GNAT family N-acetyltransferase [unclassified Granulicatella]|uniref:GNAT family N-acetyltransferase n=1 Tax=unclassified Granulicatella TaxID=2630493 RepID=UPI0010736553|nr:MULTISPECIES: GNAT family protein [unclassified Granulicatella]MBF0780077.1 GNAT family N-acetyltransferase [Granulicatella sp. 19428wC4_WM01]TFU95859.1 N-acetyltransferase [Granulicatella sp. WM01]